MDLKFNGTDSECATRPTIAYTVFWILPVVKLLLVRTPPICATIFDGLTVCLSISR